MAIKPLNEHYSFTTEPSVYDEEALTALELAGRTTSKVNEVVETVNVFGERINAQDEHINTSLSSQDNRITTTLTNQDNRINQYTETFFTRLNEMDAKLKESLDNQNPEVTEARKTWWGLEAPNLGTAIRESFLFEYECMSPVFRHPGSVEIDTENKKIKFTEEWYAVHKDRRYNFRAQELDYSIVTSTIFYVVYLKSTGVLLAQPLSAYNRENNIPILIVNTDAASRGEYSFSPNIGDHYVNGELVSVSSPVVAYGRAFKTVNSSFKVDTANETVKTDADIYVFYGGKQFILMKQSVSYADITTNDMYIVAFPATYNESTGLTEWGIVRRSAYNPLKQVVIGHLQKNYLSRWYANTMPFPYYVDGVEIAPATNGDLTVYVDGENGNDTNDGSPNYPYKTIQAAIDAGAKNIYIKPGTYKEGINLTNRHNVKIMADWSNYESGMERPKVRINHGTVLNAVDDASGTGYKVADVSEAEDTLIYKVFHSHVLGLGNAKTGYHVTVWNGDTKLKPVATYEELADANTFHVQGGMIINCPSNTSGVFTVVNDELSNRVRKCSNITFEDIAFEYTYASALTVTDSNGIIFRNCEFNRSSMRNGLQVTDMSGELYNCDAEYNMIDGFNFNGYGETTVFNCNAGHNFDDGISHRDGCTGSIHGGRWYYNGNGGIASPTNGARVNVYDAVCENNPYAIYAKSEIVVSSEPIIVKNCVLRNCVYGIYAPEYTVYAIGNKYAGIDREATYGSHIQRID